MRAAAGAGTTMTAATRRKPLSGGRRATLRGEDSSLLRSPVPDLGLGHASDEEDGDAWEGEEEEARARETLSHRACFRARAPGRRAAVVIIGAADARTRLRAPAPARTRAARPAQMPGAEEGSGSSSAALRRSSRRHERMTLAQQSHTSLHALGVSLNTPSTGERCVVGVVMAYACLLLLSGARGAAARAGAKGAQGGAWPGRECECHCGGRRAAGAAAAAPRRATRAAPAPAGLRGARGRRARRGAARAAAAPHTPPRAPCQLSAGALCFF
jgi:hypothetical protein